MSDVIFYACGHTIAQRDLSGMMKFTISGKGDESPDICPMCTAGTTTPHDEKSMTKEQLILAMINGRKSEGRLLNINYGTGAQAHSSEAR